MATLVTGGTGLIGAEVVRLLIERGEDRPVVFDLNPSPRRLSDVADRVEIVRGDLGTFSHVLDAVKRSQPRTIYHLGGMLSLLCEGDPQAAVHANAMGTFYVLEAARLFDVPQVVFSSTLGTYGLDLGDGPLDDATLQRPTLLYGATKVFGEHLGRFYRRKYGLDFRGLRLPAIVGPGVTTPGVVQYTSLLIEAGARGQPFTVVVPPETRTPVLYIKDAARALLDLAGAPQDQIATVNYIIGGIEPVPSAAELVELVRARVPGVEIDFRPDPVLEQVIAGVARPVDDRRARLEWGWRPAYSAEAMVEDVLQEFARHPERYG